MTLRLPAALLVLAALAACDRKPTPAPTPAQAPAQAPAAPTPNLDRLAQLFAQVPMEPFALAGMNLYPTAAGFKFSDDAPPDSRQVLLKLLEDLKPTVAAALELSKSKLEPFPPMPDLSIPDAHLHHPRAHVQQITRLLLVDAARAIDADDPDAALARLAAVARFSLSLRDQHDSLIRLAGAGFAAQTSLRLNALAHDRPELFAKASPEPLADLRDLFGALDPDDPAGMVASWEADARNAVAECRKTYTAPDGPAKYAAYLRQWGAEISISGLSPGDDLDWLMPMKSFADQAAKLSPKDLAAAIDAAEAQIPALAASMRAHDLDAVRKAMIPIRDEPTQLSRMLIARAPSTLTSARTLGDAITKAKAVLNPRAPQPAAAPNLDRLAELYASIPLERIWNALAYLKPASSGLAIDADAPPNALQDTLALLDQCRPTIAGLLSLSEQPLEPFPPHATIDPANPDAAMRHPQAHIQNVSRLLQLDAARAVDAGEIDQALDRLAAIARFGVAMIRQTEDLVQITGSTTLTIACRHLVAIGDDHPDLLAKARPEARARFLAVLAPVNAADPVGVLADWERSARASLAECRARYTTPQGPANYAEDLRANGANMPLTDLVPGDELDSLSPLKSFADQAAKLAPADLAAALDRAEQTIPALAAALRARDLEAARRLMTAVRDDPTQVSRMVLSGTPMRLASVQTSRSFIEQARALLSPPPAR